MNHILKNADLKIYVDLPDEGYSNSRFDWTGKIKAVEYNGKPITTSETPNQTNYQLYGAGFYNEFGIETPLGYEETKDGEWFHKIGVGLLKKEGSVYDFHKHYEIKPADFEVHTETNKIRFICTSASVNGYSYVLEKEIELQDHGFNVRYHLQNTGTKAIVTDEYNHNFILIDNQPIGRDYELDFPFSIKPKLFNKTVNPEEKVLLGSQDIKFTDTPTTDFFFSNLSGGKSVNAQWELLNRKNNIRISEQGDFATEAINLWGQKDVICPELFIQLNILPGQSKRWSRCYKIYTTS